MKIKVEIKEPLGDERHERKWKILFDVIKKNKERQRKRLLDPEYEVKKLWAKVCSMPGAES